MSTDLPNDLADQLGAAAPELDWLRAPELITDRGLTYWRDAGVRPVVAAEALAALRSLGFDIDPTRGTVHGPLVVRS